MGYILKYRMIFDLKSKRILYVKDGKEDRNGREAMAWWDIYSLCSGLYMDAVRAPECDGIV